MDILSCKNSHLRVLLNGINQFILIRAISIVNSMVNTTLYYQFHLTLHILQPNLNIPILRLNRIMEVNLTKINKNKKSLKKQLENSLRMEGDIYISVLS